MICVPYLLKVFELQYLMAREVGKAGMFAAIVMQRWPLRSQAQAKVEDDQELQRYVIRRSEQRAPRGVSNTVEVECASRCFTSYISAPS